MIGFKKKFYNYSKFEIISKPEMTTKKHNLIYQTTNTVTGKIYIGRHSTNKLNDGYLGSGKEIKKDIKLFGRKIFNREILFDFDNPEDMIAKEIELLTEEFVYNDGNYNLGSGQGGLFTHDEITREKLRTAHKGTVLVYDLEGNYLRVPVNDPRYIYGELRHNLYGTICVKDTDGKQFRVLYDDPRWLSGELVGVNKNNIRPKETVDKHTEFMKDYWKSHKHSDVSIEKMRSVNKGKVTVKDLNGNLFRVDVTDERIKTGELVNAYLGKKMSDEFKRKISENKKENRWMNNPVIHKTKLVKPNLIDQLLSEGWIFGRAVNKRKVLKNEEILIGNK